MNGKRAKKKRRGKLLVAAKKQRLHIHIAKGGQVVILIVVGFMKLDIQIFNQNIMIK